MAFLVVFGVTVLNFIQVYHIYADDTDCISANRNCSTQSEDKINVVNGGESNGNIKEKYLLVPPFLIGASVVIILYGIINCLYTYCYTNSRVQNMVKQLSHSPTIIFQEDSNSGQTHSFTPVVKMEGAYGKTEIMETQPFLICQPIEEEEETRPNIRKSSSIMRGLKNVLPGRKQRPSTSSYSGVFENELRPEGQGTNELKRASICFVPVGRTLSDPSNKNTEWTPLQGFVYTSFVWSRPRNLSYKRACTSESSFSKEDTDPIGSYIVLPKAAPPQSQSSANSNVTTGDSDDVFKPVLIINNPCAN